MSRLRDSFAPYWQSIQEALFPHLEQTLGPLTAKQQQLVQTLEVIRIEQWIPPQFRAPGRPPSDRAALARAFVAKAVYDMPTTRVLLDRLDTDVALRRLCGWERRSQVPSESVFSRAFAEFARSQLPQPGARGVGPQDPRRAVGGPSLPRLDGHRGPREACRQGEGANASQGSAQK